MKIDSVIGFDGSELFMRHWMKVFWGEFVAKVEEKRERNTTIGSNILLLLNVGNEPRKEITNVLYMSNYVVTCE